MTDLENICTCGGDPGHDIAAHQHQIEDMSPAATVRVRTVMGRCKAEGCPCGNFRWRNLVKTIRLQPAEFYAWKKTGVVLTPSMRSWMSAEHLSQYQAAIKEYHEQRKAKDAAVALRQSPEELPVQKIDGVIGLLKPWPGGKLVCPRCTEPSREIYHDGKLLRGVEECPSCGLLAATPICAPLAGKVVYHARRRGSDPWTYQWHGEDLKCDWCPAWKAPRY